jgi:hypothetical protein
VAAALTALSMIIIRRRRRRMAYNITIGNVKKKTALKI